MKYIRLQRMLPILLTSPLDQKVVRSTMAGALDESFSTLAEFEINQIEELASVANLENLTTHVAAIVYGRVEEISARVEV